MLNSSTFTTDNSQYALPIVDETGHGLRATGVGADFAINTTLAAGNLSRVSIAIGALPPARASRFVHELRNLEDELTRLSQTAGVIGERASALHCQVADAMAQRKACSAHDHVGLTTMAAAAAPAVHTDSQL